MKIGPTVADKLENRFKRLGRSPTGTTPSTSTRAPGDRWDFDVEGSTPSPIDVSRYELKDIEAMLMDQWNEHWGDPVSAQLNRSETAQASQNGQAATTRKRATIAASPKVSRTSPLLGAEGLPGG